MFSLPPSLRSLVRGARPFVIASGLMVITMFASQKAYAWNAVGHMTIGAIAESRLNDNAKRQVALLLPLVADTRSPDFMTACVWMDDIRSDGVHLYDHWHVADVGYSLDGTPTNARNTDNVAWAIAQNIRVLKDEKTSNEEKARSLRFVLHTVEDVHNPLHCGSRFSKDSPTGDSGGNRFQLENVDGARNLHALWDGALGTFKSSREPRLGTEDKLRALAVTLTGKYPEASLPQSSELDPEKWVEEGSALLKSDLYPASPTPDAAYIARFQPVAEKQATLAGYRLANVLNSIWP